MGANKWWVEGGKDRVKLSKAFKMLTVIISDWEKHLGVNMWKQYVVLDHVLTPHMMNYLMLPKLVQHRHILSCQMLTMIISNWKKHLGVNKWEKYGVLNNVLTLHRKNCWILPKLVQHRHILSCIDISW